MMQPWLGTSPCSHLMPGAAGGQNLHPGCWGVIQAWDSGVFATWLRKRSTFKSMRTSPVQTPKLGHFMEETAQQWGSPWVQTPRGSWYWNGTESVCLKFFILNFVYVKRKLPKSQRVLQVSVKGSLKRWEIFRILGKGSEGVRLPQEPSVSISGWSGWMSEWNGTNTILQLLKTAWNTLYSSPNINLLKVE